MIENLPVRAQRCRVSRGARWTLLREAGTGTLLFEDQTMGFV